MLPSFELAAAGPGEGVFPAAGRLGALAAELAAKEICMHELEAGALEKLRSEQAAPEWQTGAKGEPLPAEKFRSLHDHLQTIPDFRKTPGQRYGIACYMTIMIAARLSG